MALHGKNNRISASSSKRVSRKMSDSMVGSHHLPSTSDSGPQRMSDSNLRFSNARHGKKAERGMIESITPETESGETKRQHARRMGSNDFTKEAKRKSRLSRFAIIMIVLVLVAVAAASTGVFTFITSVNTKLAFSDTSFIEELVKQPEEEPYYVLFGADLNSNNGTTDEWEAVILARVDEQNNAVSLLSVPTNLAVRLSDGKIHPLYEAFEMGGLSEYVDAIGNYMGIGISHVMFANADCLSAIIEQVNGVTMTLEEEIDDPAAGDIYLPPGERKLTSRESLVFLRATNLGTGITARATNQVTYAAALAEKVFAIDEVQFLLHMDEMVTGMKSDWDCIDLISLKRALHGFKAENALVGHVTGYEKLQDGGMIFNASKDWPGVLESFVGGEEPVVPMEEIENVDPSSFTICVKNGSGVAGGAGKLADILTNAGFNVVETGNAEEFVYDETLIIYGDTSMYAAAQAVQRALGSGRVITAGSFYALDTDVLVILGSDWKVVN